MGVILKLDPHLVNQIAAGEVIERPASVVKELLENAIDAEAAQVEVEIEDGGKKLIRVRDDGVGMTAEDLPLSLASHATSKLRSSEDLDHIVTFGFRGEALASIGSISQTTITTRRHDAIAGHALEMTGGQLGEVRVAGGPPGTMIEVRNLFYNIPARRKFMKSSATELGHVVDALAAMALAFPQVGIRLKHDGRIVHDLPPAAGLQERVSAFFGRHLAESLLEVTGDSPAGQLWGLVAPPSESRASTRMQYLYVNGRYVRDRMLMHALREAYRGLIDANRQPVVFLFLTVPPEDVDVNVHPTKIEVRLRQGQQLYREVLGTLRTKFLRSDLTPRLEGRLDGGTVGGAVGFALESADHRPGPAAGDDRGDALSMAEREERLRRSMADFLRASPGTSQHRFTYSPGTGGRGLAPQQTPTPDKLEADEARSREEPPAAPTAAAADDAAGAMAGEAAGGPAAGEQFGGPKPRVMQFQNSYLVAETSEGILIVDQHALHERVLYEDLRRRFNQGPLESQRLLLPAVMDVTERERAFLEQFREQFARLGIEFELFGSRSIGIQAFPAMLGQRADPERSLRDLLEWAVAHGVSPTVEAVLDELLHRIACRAAVKAGEALSPDEIEALLAKRQADLQTATCPHGRPTSLILTRGEIERQFKRDYVSTRPQDDETVPVKE